MEEQAIELWMLEDTEALIDHLMDEHGQDILQLVFSYVKNKQIAEDLTQEIFIKCYQNLHQYNRKAKLKTWLWRIAANHCKDYLRSWHAKHIIVSDEQAKTSASLKEEVEKSVIRKDEDEQLAQAVMNLPDNYREVIHLFYFDELAIKEISSLTGLNSNTIKTRLKRAKELLRASLEEY